MRLGRGYSIELHIPRIGLEFMTKPRADKKYVAYIFKRLKKMGFKVYPYQHRDNGRRELITEDELYAPEKRRKF